MPRPRSSPLRVGGAMIQSRTPPTLEAPTCVAPGGVIRTFASLARPPRYMAVMVLALSINDAGTAQRYRHQQHVGLACSLLLTWISRVWMLAHRGKMNEDPVIFAVKDRMSLAMGALLAVVFWAAI